MKNFFFGIVFIYLYLFNPNLVLASEKFITIVNPIRISTYSSNSLQSLKNQYSEVKVRNLKATWLLTYDVLNNTDLVDEIVTFDDQQELGLFLEITPQITHEVGIIYPKTDSWHRANAVFLAGYAPPERKLLLDKLFEKYKQSFGRYPVSVGAWWVDAYSLNYMKNKYGIKSILVCADQFSTDGYQIWGQHWSLPYVPNNKHPAVPADDSSNDSGVVAIQWAMRDPLNGYHTPSGKRASLYSTQDYFTVNLDDDYLKNLAEVYLNNSSHIAQLTLGLEGDFEPNTYKDGHYIKYLDLANNLQKSGVQIVKMSEFSDWYRSKGQINSVQIIQTKDILKSDKTVIWYQSSQYRVGMTYDQSFFEIFDLRFYDQSYVDPYKEVRNYYPDLEINIPALIDSASNSNEKLIISQPVLSTHINDLMLSVDFGQNQNIKFDKNQIIFTGLDQWIKNKIPGLTYEKNQLSSTNQTSYEDQNQFFIAQHINAKITDKKIIFVMTLIFFMIGFGLLFIFINRDLGYFVSKLLIIGFLIGTLILILTYQPIFQTYLISAEEVAALRKMANSSNSRILVSTNKCVNCQFGYVDLPLFFTGQRSYIAKLSNQKIYKSNLLPISTEQKHLIEEKYTRDQLYEYLTTTGANYIYLVKYGNYEEVLPYSPGDLGVEKVFNNAHVQIWRVIR